MKHYDIAIIGLGAMGSSTLYHLSALGKTIVGVDQFRPPHNRGSSHGETRITGLCVVEGDEYVKFVRRSNQLWRQLEEESGRSLFVQSGGLVYGTPQSGVPSGSLLEQSLAVAQRNSIEHMVYEGAELRSRFPQFCFADGDIGFFEPSAGYLYPERIIQTHLELAESRGATTIMGSKVQEIRKEKGVFHRAISRL